MNNKIRTAAVAGTFYPINPTELRCLVEEYLQNINATTLSTVGGLKALIVPHAGYSFSGPIAGSGYQLVEKGQEKPNRIWLIGPSHQHYFQGLGVSTDDFWQTPLGKVTVDKLANQLVNKISSLFVGDSNVHSNEHCLEVQLPFLQQTLGRFSVIPLLTGEVNPLTAAEIINDELSEKDCLIVSSDLSHYLNYNQAVTLDTKTINAIISLHTNILRDDQACGITGIKIVMELAKLNHWQVKLIDYRNSGDTAGEKDRVVGYASIGFWGDL